ncbi:Ski complex subunit Rec14 [Tilletia horrida]|uniref:Ski complex subunit Rec14 n=1 Tax=Tilletia horrida TaxID=155126 RepID=A0AAN6GFJ7_9BASI|nr:Ski complex subunit Rec14 [Tilletia horrida]
MSLQFFEYAAAEEQRPLFCSAWADNGTLLTAGAAGRLEAWNALTGHRLPAELQPKRTAVSPADAITSLTLSSASGASSSSSSSLWAGQLALTSSLGGTLSLHGLPESYADGQAPHLLAKVTLSAEKAAQSSFASTLRPQGDLAVGTGLGGQAHVWKVVSGGAGDQPFALEPTATVGPEGGNEPCRSGLAVEWGMSCAFNDDGSRLAIGTRSGQVHVYDVSTERLSHLSTMSSHAAPTRALAFTPASSSYLVAGSDDRLVTVHDVRLPSNAAGSGSASKSDNRSVVACLQGHGGWIRGVAPARGSTGDRLIASVSQDGSVRLWDISLSPKTSVFSTPPNLSSPLSSISWSPAMNGSHALADSTPGSQQVGIIGSGAGTGAFVTTSEGNLGGASSSSTRGASVAASDDGQTEAAPAGEPPFRLLPTVAPMLSFYRSASSVVPSPRGLHGASDAEEALLEDVEREAEGTAE